jgi:hypothetical protein
MSVSWRLSLGLGLALAVPTAAYALPPGHHQHTHAYHRTAVYRAAPPAPMLVSAPNFGFWPSSYPISHRQYEIEGLTRNMDDCARYGCIGNN